MTQNNRDHTFPQAPHAVYVRYYVYKLQYFSIIRVDTFCKVCTYMANISRCIVPSALKMRPLHHLTNVTPCCLQTLYKTCCSQPVFYCCRHQGVGQFHDRNLKRTETNIYIGYRYLLQRKFTFTPKKNIIRENQRNKI